MDEWESVRQKIKDMQTNFLNTGGEVRSTLDNVSVADYWKRRYDEEKSLWEERLSVKEKEQEKIKEKYLEDDRGLREMNIKLKELENRLSTEKIIWEGETKIKLLEAELDKRKIEYDAKLRNLEEENERLRTSLRLGKASTEDSDKHRQEMEAQKIRLEEVIKNLQMQIQAQAAEEDKKIQLMEYEKRDLQKQMIEMQNSKKEYKDRSAEVDKEIALLNAERDRQLSQLSEREKEQFETFEGLTRGFTHKVRNYLGIMSGTLQLCIANFKMEEELKNQVTLVDQNAQEMLKAIEEFLSLVKVPELSRVPTNMNEFLANTLFAIEDLAKKNNIRFEKKFAIPLPPLAIDSTLLMEAIKQILYNAIEASVHDGVITVTTLHDAQNNRVTIKIADTGKGISDNHLKKIFQPYFSSKKGKKGLGLSVAKRAIDLHHGSLSVSSQKDHGTTVTVQIPIIK